MQKDDKKKKVNKLRGIKTEMSITKWDPKKNNITRKRKEISAKWKQE